MFEELQSSGPDPCTFDGNVGNLGAYQFADSAPSRVARQNLEHKCRNANFLPGLLKIERFVLVAHRASGDPQGTLVQRSYQGVGVDKEFRRTQLLWKSAQFAARGDRRKIVQIHRQQKLALPL